MTSANFKSAIGQETAALLRSPTLGRNGASPQLQAPDVTRPGKRLQFAIENGPVEIVDLAIENGVFP